LGDGNNTNKLLLDEYPLIILPQLACRIGLQEAVILQQLHYWLLRSTNKQCGKKWVYKSYDEWHQEFPFWSSSTIRRIITGLEKQGLINSGVFNQYQIDRTKWYTIDYEELERQTSRSDK